MRKAKNRAHGFGADFPELITRRKFALGAAALFAPSPILSQTRTPEILSANGQCLLSPSETAGPFPADGTNSYQGALLNLLDKSGVIRRDIRQSFAGKSGQAAGVELDLAMELVDVRSNCTPLSGFAVYLWQCDAKARYSIYQQNDQNYLRGVGISDQSGIVRFTSIFPGCYGGRWPHVHFEVFASPAKMASGHESILISQFAFPEAISHQIYAQDNRYGGSASRLGRLSLKRDIVFADNSAAQIQSQMLAISGNPTTKLSGTIRVGVA